MKKIIKAIVNSLGYTIFRSSNIKTYDTPSNQAHTQFSDLSDEVKDLHNQAKPHTMISLENFEAIINSIDYICKNNIEGDIVECGVWKGGAMFAAAKALVNRNVFDKKFYLFDTYNTDTFGSTTNETEYDKDFTGKTAAEAINDGSFVKDNFKYNLEEVKALMESTGYPKQNFIYVIGRVEDTIPCHDISQICLLRLDTDWYESTKHELVHLYPLLVKKGVLLVDDYGFWQGSRKACDEYFAEKDINLMLHRSDYAGRSAIKTD